MSSHCVPDRFRAFLDSQFGTECIDAIELTPEQAAAEHADYFLQDRRIVVEIKSLKTDTAPKMESILAPHRGRPEFKAISSKSIDTILDLLPDGDEIRAKLFLAITESVEGAVEKANRQIRETKRTFRLPDAYGLLVLMNDSVVILPPTTVAKRVAQSLMKRTQTGASRFSEIDTAWLMNERHFAEIGGRKAVLDIVLAARESTRSKYVGAVTGLMSEEWARYNKKEFARGSEDLLQDLRFRRNPKRDA
jgi:hypothetical protein